MESNQQNSKSELIWGVIIIVGVTAVLNIVPRLISMPDIEISLPDLPGWLEAALQIKNVMIVLVLVAVAVHFGAKELSKRRALRGSDDE